MIQNLSEKIDNNIKSISNFTNIESKSNIFLKNYPVGSVYMSEKSTSLEELFGGESEHTLTLDEMPNHNHSLNGFFFYWGITSGLYYPITVSNFNAYAGYPTGNNLVTDQAKWNVTNYAGKSNAHNNMPPYLTVYMWKRTA